VDHRIPPRLDHPNTPCPVRLVLDELRGATNAAERQVDLSRGAAPLCAAFGTVFSFAMVVPEVACGASPV
jgi:hypothetical protein